MRYLISEVKEPLTYASSGMLIHSDQFLHPRRCIDTYVLLLIQQGTLCITMDNMKSGRTSFFSFSREDFISEPLPPGVCSPTTGCISP